MDTELFMECEEEELEPWQQVADSVEEDDIDFIDSCCEPGEDSLLPASETPPPGTPPPIPPPTASPLVQILRSPAKPPLPPPRPRPSFITSSRPAPSSTPALAPPLMAQAPPLFLTQTGGTFLLPAAPGTPHCQPVLLATQGFPVMKRGAPLLLNLQPVQSLGQLVRPSVGVSPVHQVVQARAAPPPSHVPGTAFTAIKLPTALSSRTGTPAPVNHQMTEVGGANCLKMAACPALPSGSANGVARISPFSSAPDPAPFASAVPAHCMTPSLTSNPHRVVMSVEEFYYGTLEGDLSLRKPLRIKTSFTCQICTYRAENNLRLMQHMLQHSELVGGTSEDRKCCRFCYRQFSSPSQLQSHEEQVHGPAPSACLCRICEWAFENEPAFLNHMKSNHQPGEMPYLCQVCSHRSSFYADILQHFASFHRDSGFLMCLFCLKVTRNPVSYQQHLSRHQMNQAFHCNRCRLQFIFLKDKMQHKQENHRSFRRPAELEGLPPGSKQVTIRTCGKIRPLLQSPASLIQPINIKSETSPLHRSPALLRSSPPRHVNRSSGGGGDHLVCLECGSRVLDFSAHYPTHVRCLLCPYSSCCSRAYASHMIHHVPRTKDRVLPLHRRCPPCVYLLCCSQCDFSPQTADQMAKHLLRNPLHHSATCRPRRCIEPDIQFCLQKERRPASGEEPVQSADLPNPSWRSASRWKLPSESEEFAPVLPFQQSTGPHHFLSKNTDAIDFFHLLFPQELTELITKETNAHAKTCRFMGLGYSDWVPTTVHEVKGFLGLVILMGLHNLPDPSQYWSWSHYDNSYAFYRAMSFKRFQQITANIRMGSFATEQLCGTSNPNDPLHIFRPMLRLLGAAMWSAYKPNCCLSVDQALLPGPDEAGSKTRPKAWLLCDSKSGYCHRFFIQAGEGEGLGQGFTVVPELVEDLEDKHHQLYLASSLASVPLMQKLLDLGIYASSSFPPLSPVLPRELWEEGHLERPGDFLQRRFGSLLATRWRDTKEMGCLSTNAAPGEQDTVWRRSQTRVGGLDPVDRPMAFCLLQENMRGVDICKQLLACNPLGGILQDRHWRGLFWFLVNLSIVNAFIVLRESRKENPPAWVQDGLFTQVSFRKRLGNQLAKCAQNHSETVEIAGSRATRAEAPVEQRHRMGKISSISKRCKTCHLKNLRHESVYGCVVCRANLCKHPSCFWEFHGLSPRNKGSTRVGFIKDRISGDVTVKEVEDNVDGAMAPVEDFDFSDNDVDDIEYDDVDDIKEELVEEVKPLTSRPSSMTTKGATASSVGKDDFLTARKLRVALSALCDGVRQASRVFLTEPGLIRSWLREAGRRQRSAAQERPRTDGDGAARMVAWVLSMREQQLPITESNFFRKASALKKKGVFSNAFRISYNWAVGFMLEHQLGVGSSPGAALPLPPSLEAKVGSFREFTQKVVRANGLTDSAVAAMDELCLFVDVRLVQDKSRRSEALELTGSLPLVTVYLAALADGTMLPSMILANRQMSEKVLPEFIHTGPEGLPVEEALDLWTNKIWLKHVYGPARPGKSMLVLDRHREHMGDPFLAIISGAGTLPAMIPAGCSSGLQPLEVCARPVLQRFLLARWAKFIAGNPEELEETAAHQLQANVAQLLVDWLVEALTHLNQLPRLLQKSFCLSGLLREENEEEQTMSPEGIQADILKSLTEILLGPEASDDLPELLEDEEDAGEDQGDLQMAPEEEEGKEVNVEKDAIRGEEDKKETGEDREKEAEKLEEDSEEGGDETAEDRKEASKRRRETRIMVGEEVGDEWKITGKSRADGVEES
uniref:pogo transposable element derived with ZNF domain b isoform X3 n=1 Tax=Gasterosteus aculeatus aculeatus TaxID=481459 RepID=UPI001A98366C|nr:pogo transposable element derived with ZNF domain b isoform X3 [Gasterosteus aculeatus aculeatus]